VLGFRLGDFFSAPFAAEFYDVNQRHYSLAFAQSVAMRANAAANGVSQPVQVAEGNYQLGPGRPGWYEK
jgi:hypothetical protein